MRYIVPLFFLGFLILGLSIFRDYGMSWDEYISRTNGIVSMRYVVNKDQTLLTYPDRYYGPVFETLLVLAEKPLNTTDPRLIFLSRHLLTFLVFYISTIFLYLLLRLQTHNSFTALAGPVFLILSPRIFADSFYNSKDLTFLSVSIIALYTLVKFHKRPGVKIALTHALITAILIDIRIIGMAIIPLTVIFNFKNIKLLAFYILSSTFLVTLFWPVLWHNPPAEFIAAIKAMANFTPWQGEVLYMGKFITSTNLPWHYLPVWIAITTPLSLLGLGILGTIISVYKRNFLPLLWFYTPVLYVVLRHPILYDGWRHFFFIYPAWIILCVTALNYLLSIKNIYLKTIPLFLLSLDLYLVLMFMVKNHPYQNVYFNPLTGNMAQTKLNFEMDYWGLSLAEGYRFIAKNDPAQYIKIYAPFTPGELSAAVLPATQRNRLLINTESPAGAKYFIGNYRWHPQKYPFPIPPIFERKVAGVPIVSVYDISRLKIVTN